MLTKKYKSEAFRKLKGSSAEHVRETLSVIGSKCVGGRALTKDMANQMNCRRLVGKIRCYN